MKKGYDAINIGSGINTGMLMLGTVGSVSRMDTTVIGDTVNLASRLESLTKIFKLPVIFSDAVLGRLENPDNFHLREIDAVTVKGKAVPVEVFELFDFNSPELIEKKLENMKNYRKALFHYKDGDFQYARQLFSECYQKCPEDVLLDIYIKRCENLIENPPGANWRGVSKMR